MHYSIERAGRRERKEERICRTEEREVVGKKYNWDCVIALTFGLPLYDVGSVKSRVICASAKPSRWERGTGIDGNIGNQEPVSKRSGGEKEKTCRNSHYPCSVTLKNCDKIKKTQSLKKYKEGMDM